jgi:hypothetical protein
VFERDLKLGTTSVVDVGPTGQRPSRQQVGSVLQHPSLSTDGFVAAFASTAASLTGVGGGQSHVFLRLMSPPQAYFITQPPTHSGPRVTVSVRVDDGAARSFWCQVNSGTPFACRPGRMTFGHLPRGRDTVRIRAGGPGLLYEQAPLGFNVRVT